MQSPGNSERGRPIDIATAKLDEVLYEDAPCYRPLLESDYTATDRGRGDLRLVHGHGGGNKTDGETTDNTAYDKHGPVLEKRMVTGRSQKVKARVRTCAAHCKIDPITQIQPARMIAFFRPSLSARCETAREPANDPNGEDGGVNRYQSTTLIRITCWHRSDDRSLCIWTGLVGNSILNEHDEF